MMRGRWFLFTAAFALQGCFLNPLPDTRTPADHAREVEPLCRGLSEDAITPFLTRDAVDSVEPSYSVVPSGNNQETHLRGARIHVRPLPNITKESLARGLQCHQARATLGLATAPGDPYVVRDGWLDIDVESVGNGFLVLVRSDTLDDAKEALARARSLVAPGGR